MNREASDGVAQLSEKKKHHFVSPKNAGFKISYSGNG